MSEQNELKPCPFCGGEAMMQEHPAHTHVIATFMPDHEGSWTIECSKCCAGMIDSTKDEVIAIWNRRIATEPKQAPVAWMWQHDETGRIGFVGPWQVENGWQARNPRLHLVMPVYAHPAADERKTDEQIRDAALEEAAGLCQNERLAFSDEEWRIRCEWADAIRALMGKEGKS